MAVSEILQSQFQEQDFLSSSLTKNCILPHTTYIGGLKCAPHQLFHEAGMLLPPWPRMSSWLCDASVPPLT